MSASYTLQGDIANSRKLALDIYNRRVYIADMEDAMNTTKQQANDQDELRRTKAARRLADDRELRRQLRAANASAAARWEAQFDSAEAGWEAQHGARQAELERYANEMTRGHERECRTCSHVLGMHDWPRGRCMDKACECKSYRELTYDQGNRKQGVA